MISLILPPKSQVSMAAKMLADEFGTASNIKSRVNRLSVLSAITSTQQRLKLFTRVRACQQPRARAHKRGGRGQQQHQRSGSHAAAVSIQQWQQWQQAAADSSRQQQAAAGSRSRKQLQP